MLHIARSTVGFLIGGIVFGTVLCGHAMAVEKKATPPSCYPLQAGMEAVVGVAKEHGYKVGAASAADMPKLIELMKQQGHIIVGESALIMLAPTGELAIYVKRGDKLCAAFDGKIDFTAFKSDAPAPMGRANKPNKLDEIYA